MVMNKIMIIFLKKTKGNKMNYLVSQTITKLDEPSVEPAGFFIFFITDFLCFTYFLQSA